MLRKERSFRQSLETVEVSRKVAAGMLVTDLVKEIQKMLHSSQALLLPVPPLAGEFCLSVETLGICSLSQGLRARALAQAVQHISEQSYSMMFTVT